MATENPIKVLSNGKRISEIYCMKSDFANVATTGLASGSKLYVLDTADNPKMYDADSDKWYDTTGTEFTGV